MQPEIQKNQNPGWKAFITITLVLCIVATGLAIPRFRLEYNASFYRSHWGPPHFLTVVRTGLGTSSQEDQDGWLAGGD